MNPVEALLQEIEKATKAELFYLALLLTLTLPDICAALERADGRTSGRLYKKWYKTNLIDGGLSPEEAYELRCSVTHQSTAMASSARAYSRIIFAMPKGPIRFDNMIMNDAMAFDVESFCGRWIKSTRAWIVKTDADPVVRSNLPNLLQVRPNGLAPYVSGMPIIA